ncbi:hypothetical protein [Rhodanobacter sp. T12-5]|nr:hypothetical protein [Rhodanobacter sp. T12-5]
MIAPLLVADGPIASPTRQFREIGIEAKCIATLAAELLGSR